MKSVVEFIKDYLKPARSKTVLIVDDSAVDRKFAERALADHYFVSTASCGQDGLRMALAARPDLILLDYMMPDIKGPEVCRRLKEDERTREIPVIVLTSIDTPQTVLDSFEQGAEFFLTKPIKRRDLLHQVKATLRPPVFA